MNCEGESSKVVQMDIVGVINECVDKIGNHK